MLLVCALLLIVVGTSEARLNGSATFAYRDFEASDDGETVQDWSQFTQRYSVFYSKDGLLKGGRAGKYSLGLGYEWLAANNQVNGDDNNFSDGKILYNSEITIAPGALPFRLNAFVRDRALPSFYGTSVRETILEPEFELDFGTGEQREIGLNLMVGIKNGSYLGRYREVLSKFPRLFIDYNDVYVRNVAGLNKTHYQFRDLAFVSLNKKDNWFHYRYNSHEDFNNKSNDYTRKAYILGTIDNRLKRHWIKMTNWIDLSTDFTFAREKNNRYFEGRQEVDSYNLNLFTSMSYNNIKVSNFSRFRREFDDVMLEKDYEIPVFASGQVSPNLGWRGSFINYSNETTFKSDVDSRPEVADFRSSLDEGTYAVGQIDMRQHARMTLSAKMEGEHYKTEYVDGIGLRLRLEGLSNVKYQNRTNYALGYDVTYQDGNKMRRDVGNLEMVDVSYLEQSLYGQYGHQLSARHKLTANQKFLFGSGDINPGVTSFISGKGGNSLSAGSQDFDDANGTVLRSVSTVSLESNLMARLSNRIKASMEWVDNPGGQFYQASLEQNLRYDGRRLRFRTRNFFTIGDNVEQVRLATRNNAKKSLNDEANYVFGSESKLTYRPNRNFDSKLSLDFSFLDFDSGDAYETSIELRNQYAFFSKGGMSRLVGSLYNETEYTLTSRREGDSSYALRFLLGGSYNPYRMLSLGGEFEYQRYDFNGYRTYKLRTDAGLMFAKLQCHLSYSYALGQGGDYLSGDRKEHLIEAEVKKFF